MTFDQIIALLEAEVAKLEGEVVADASGLVKYLKSILAGIRMGDMASILVAVAQLLAEVDADAKVLAQDVNALIPANYKAFAQGKGTLWGMIVLPFLGDVTFELYKGNHDAFIAAVAAGPDNGGVAL